MYARANSVVQDHWTSLSPTFLRAIGRDSPPWDDGTSAAAGAGSTPSPAAVAAVRTRIAKLARDRHPAAVRFVQNLFSALDWSVTEATVSLRAGAAATAAGRSSVFTTTQRRRLLIFFSIAVTCAQLMAFLVSDVPSLFLQGPPVLADRLAEMLAFLIVHAPVDASSDEYAVLVLSAGAVDRTNNPFLHPLALARPLVAMLGSLWTRERGVCTSNGATAAASPATEEHNTAERATAAADGAVGSEVYEDAPDAGDSSLHDADEEAVDEPGTPAQGTCTASISVAVSDEPVGGGAAESADARLVENGSSVPSSSRPVATNGAASMSAAADATMMACGTSLPTTQISDPGHPASATFAAPPQAAVVDFAIEQSVVERLCAMPAACPNEHLDELRSAVLNADEVPEGSTEGHEQLRDHCRAVAEMVEYFVARRARTNLMEVEVPEDFMDPITMACMVDPVRLPDSRVVLDRATIERHLEESSVDPYSRSPLEATSLEPLPELKKQIEEWRKALAAKTLKEASTSLDGMRTSGGVSSRGEGQLPAAATHVSIVSHVPDSWDVDSDHEDQAAA
jgi:hypothetical protein